MNLGPAELLVILIFVLLIVGPEKLPKAGTTICKAIRQFREAENNVNETLKKEGLDQETLRKANENPFLAVEKLSDAVSKLDPDDLDFDSEDSKAAKEEVKNNSSSDEGSDVKSHSGKDDAASAAKHSEGDVETAENASASGSHDSAGASVGTETSGGVNHAGNSKVMKLSDVESFTERKRKLQELRKSRKSADENSDGEKVEVSASSGEEEKAPTRRL